MLQISVQSSASVFIDQKNIEFSEDSKLNVLVTTSVLSEIIIAPVAEVKWWIIAVASLAGVLLLVGIVLLLWKVRSKANLRREIPFVVCYVDKFRIMVSTLLME